MSGSRVRAGSRHGTGGHRARSRRSAHTAPLELSWVDPPSGYRGRRRRATFPHRPTLIRRGTSARRAVPGRQPALAGLPGPARRERRTAVGGAGRGSWALVKFSLAVAVLALAVTAVASPAPAATPSPLGGPVNGRIDQVEVLPDDGEVFGDATAADLAGVISASGQIRLPVRDGLEVAVVPGAGAGGPGTPAGADPPAAGGTAGSDSDTVDNEPLSTPPGSDDEASTIPARALAAYTGAADRLATEQPGCFLHWSLLAGIGAIESGHGQGATIDADGRARPTVVGPRLDGSAGMFRVRDTDDGWLDGDRRLDRAVGPMQFTPAMWRWAGRDADGDGRADPNDFDDATLAAATELCGAGDLRIPDNVLAAVRSYNPAESYLRSALGWAAWYAVGPTVVSNLGDDLADEPASDDADQADSSATVGPPTDQPLQVTALTPVGDPAGGCAPAVIDGESISASGVGGDTLLGTDHESLEVRGRITGTADRTVTIELTLLDKDGATVATGFSARTVRADDVASLGRVDGLAIGRADGRGPFEVVVRVLPGGQDCPVAEARAGVDLRPADFAGAPPTIASLRRHLETYRDTGRITRTAATDLLATLPAGDGTLHATVELARFLDRLAVAIRIGEISVEARTGLGEVATALRAQAAGGSAEPPAGGGSGATGGAGSAGSGDVRLPFDIVPLAPQQ